MPRRTLAMAALDSRTVRTTTAIPMPGTSTWHPSRASLIVSLDDAERKRKFLRLPCRPSDRGSAIPVEAETRIERIRLEAAKPAAKPFVWPADPDKIIAAAKSRASSVDSIH